MVTVEGLEKLTRKEIKKALGFQYFALPSGGQKDWERILPGIIDEVKETETIKFAHKVWVLDFTRAKRYYGTTGVDIGCSTVHHASRERG